MPDTIRPSQITYGPTTVVAARPIQPTKRNTVTLTEQQRAEIAKRNTDRSDRIEATIKEVYDFAETKAKYLAETCGHKQDYYLRLIFSGGATLQKTRKPNPYNAWSHQLAKEKNTGADPGEASNLLDLQQQYREQYDKLTSQQKEDLCALLEEERDSRTFGVHLVGLKCRCGIEAFIGLVRNNTEYELRPQWFFTSPQINRYLTGAIKKWDVEVIGSQFEAFSIAGCELFTFLRTTRDQADWIKNEIRERVNLLLVEATGHKNIIMQYKNYEKLIVVDLGFEIVGWTHEVFGCPSSLPSTIEPLKKLRDALDNGECYFRRLSHSERELRRCAFEELAQAGLVKTRKGRSDKGKKRKSYRRKSSDSDKENRRPNKRYRGEDADAGESSPSEDSSDDM